MEAEVTTTTQPTADALGEARRFLEDLGRRRGRRVLSDHHWAALLAGGNEGSPLLAAVTARDGRGITGYAQVVAGNAASSVELAVDDRPQHGSADTTAAALLDAAVHVRRDVPGPLQWWVHEPGAAQRAVAAAAGFRPDRHLLQMRRPLPTGFAPGVPTRPFRPGEDDDAWLAVNNRAFAGHPEQGAWTPDTLRQRMAEPWFDADGFRLHERDGRLAAFCWTKLHTTATSGEEPVLGEIYVIGVDPDFQGLGLGRALTLAGLESIGDRGVTTGMLYVDAANTAAVGLYQALGFQTHHVDVAYAAPDPDLPPSTP